MKLFYRPTDKLTIEVEFNDTKELFEKISPVQEVMSSAVCGKCKSTDIIMHVRQVGDDKFYEMKCKCGAVLPFGVRKQGGILFPKRYEEEEVIENSKKVKKKNYLKDMGWTKWCQEQKKRI